MATPMNYVSAAVQDACAVQVAPGNDVLVLEDAEPTFAQLLRDLAAAECSINIEHFKIQSDVTGWEFANVLAERALDGVAVNLLYDAVGSLAASDDLWAFLAGAGVTVRMFHSFSAGPRAIVRTHRKLIIIDGRVAYTGGHCIGDEWSGRVPGERPWRDTLCRIAGPAVATLQAAFCELWEPAGGARCERDDQRYFPALEPVGSLEVMTLACGSERSIKHAYSAVIATARERVRISNAYFYPDHGIVAALKQAARRGVKVQIIVPGRSDVDIMVTAARSIYSQLLDAGVEIYEYQPTVLHAKTAVVDGCWAMIGSCNLDARSLDVNYEMNVGISGAEIAAQLEARFAGDLQECLAIDRASWGRRPLKQKAGELIVAMFGSQL